MVFAIYTLTKKFIMKHFLIWIINPSNGNTEKKRVSVLNGYKLDKAELVYNMATFLKVPIKNIIAYK